MRRFISYLALSLGALITVGATFSSVLVKSQSNLEYSDGKAYVYRISEEGKDLEADTINEVTKIMEERIRTTGLTEYEIVQEGKDTVKVVFRERSDESYAYLDRYLRFNGSFFFGTDTNVMAIGNEVMTDKDAYLTFDNSYPTIVLPVNSSSNDFKQVMEEAKKLKENAKPEENADGEAQEATPIYLYLGGNYKEGDQISQMVEGKEDYDVTKKENLVLRYEYDETLMFTNEEKNELKLSLNIDPDGDGAYNAKDMKMATDMANFYVNELNASKLPCNVKFMYRIDNVPAHFENLVNIGMQKLPAWSMTLIASLIAILLAGLVLSCFYHHAALGVTTVSVVSAYLALTFSILFSTEITLAAIIGIILTGIASIACGVVYVTKVKEEAYRGRSLKKANAEGAKKALLPIIDINIVLALVGIGAFALGGPAMVPFAATTIFGAIASLILNIFFLKLLMWLLTNNTKFLGKYEVIGVDSKQVPDVLKEEEQKYFGPFQDKPLNKRHKLTVIIASVLAVASLGGIIAFGCIDNGQMFNHGAAESENSYVYFETQNMNKEGNNHSVYNTDSVTDLLNHTFVGDSENHIEYESVVTYKLKDIEKDSTGANYEFYRYYIVATLPSKYVGSMEATVKEYQDIPTFTAKLDVLFEEFVGIKQNDPNITASFKETKVVSTPAPRSDMVLYGALLSLALASLYLAARYGLSKGSATLVVSMIASIIPVGVFALTRIPSLESLIYVAPVTLFVSLVATIFYMNKDKEMASEDYVRTKDNSVEHRAEIMKKSNALSYGPMLLFVTISFLAVLPYFGIGPSSPSMNFLAMMLGFFVAGVLVNLTYAQLAQNFFALYAKSGIKAKLPKKPKKKKKQTPKNKGSEPEEAIFIGIND